MKVLMEKKDVVQMIQIVLFFKYFSINFINRIRIVFILIYKYLN